MNMYLVIGLPAAFCLGAVAMSLLHIAKRQKSILTARHLRPNPYGNSWSVSYPVEEPLARSGGAYQKTGIQIGNLVEKKNKAYGDSFLKSESVLKTLYPKGIRPEQYGDLLAIVRVVDKLFRVATQKDALGENPWQDIAGYGILKTAQSHDEEAQ